MHSLKLLVVLCAVVVGVQGELLAQWVPTGGPNTNTVTSLLVNGPTMYAGTFGGGVYVTTNDGNSWDALNNGLTSPIVNALVATSEVMFAGTAGEGVFRSTNNGVEWRSVNAVDMSVDISAMLVHNGKVYASSYDGVYVSSDNGLSWTTINSGFTSTSVSSLAAIGDYLFAGTTDGVFRSNNGGTSWEPAHNGMLNLFTTSLSVAESFLFAATTDGVFLSKNNGQQWAVCGLENSTFITSVVANGNMFVGTIGAGVLRSTDNAKTWTSIGTGFVNSDVRALLVKGDNIFAATYGAGVWKRPLTEIVTGITADPEPLGTRQSHLIQSVYPNPVDDKASIELNLSTTSMVVVEIFDVAQHLVAQTRNEPLANGPYTASVDVSGLPSGVYYVRIQANGEIGTTTVTVIH